MPELQGANPSFAMSCGINVDKMRILGTVLSTAAGGHGDGDILPEPWAGFLLVSHQGSAV